MSFPGIHSIYLYHSVMHRREGTLWIPPNTGMDSKGCISYHTRIQSILTILQAKNTIYCNIHVYEKSFCRVLRKTNIMNVMINMTCILKKQKNTYSRENHLTLWGLWTWNFTSPRDWAPFGDFQFNFLLNQSFMD